MVGLRLVSESTLGEVFMKGGLMIAPTLARETICFAN